MQPKGPIVRKHSHNKIFGGVLGLPEELSPSPSFPLFLQNKPVLLFNARSCIKLVLDQIKPKRIWLPSYLTNDILVGINQKITKMFYPVGFSLEISNDNFINLIDHDDLFFFIDYFGFPFEKEILEEVKSRNCLLFRDCTQALFHNWKTDSCDYYIFAPRKFLGIPDGGILYCKDELIFNQSDFYRPHTDTMYKLFCSTLLRREFDIYGGDRKWFEFYQQGEAELIAGNQLMSDLSILLLKHAFDYEEIKRKRRLNYRILNKKLSKLAVFPDMDENVVPIGYPITLDNRDKVRRVLFKKKIYPPIHWDIQNIVPNNFIESHHLSQRIMTLPCDQRYNEDDMNFIADTFLGIINH